MKRVGVVTGRQFGYLYIDGIPYNPVKVARFLVKGAGIKLQDMVIYEADGNVLNFIKNAIYKDGTEIRMVKEFVKASELAKATIGQVSDGVSDEIRKELAEGGAVITNDGVFILTKDPEPVQDFKAAVSATPECTLETCFTEQELSQMLPDQKRTISIILQSSLKIAVDLNAIADRDFDMEKIKADTIAITRWIDANSTQIL